MATIPVNSTVDAEDAPRLSRQCNVLLERLRRAPLTNVEAAVELRILNLTARVSELRKVGHAVEATRQEGGVWMYRLASTPSAPVVQGPAPRRSRRAKPAPVRREKQEPHRNREQLKLIF